MKFTLDVQDTEQLANICGSLDCNLNLISKSLGVDISNSGPLFRVEGENSIIAQDIFKDLVNLSLSQVVSANDVQHIIHHHSSASKVGKIEHIKLKRKQIHIRLPNQQEYIHSIEDNNCTFGIGPAGTGKTFLAVAKAVDALEKSQVRRIVLVRPAVEAGEKLGFLPGDMNEKVDPYLRPIYDALYDMLGFEKVGRLLDKNIIEVAPLAFMRGRTLNDSFVILDEAQNTTIEQMKMFLTRLGFGSKMVITGDITQIDLARPNQSGLLHCIKILKNIEDLKFIFFESKDVVRHKLVKKIVEAYDQNSNSSS